MDKCRAYYTGWSKSEKQLSYTNAYIWILESWYWWTCFKSSSGDPDTENRLMDKVGQGEEGERYGESNMETYITLCKIDSTWELLYDSGENTLWGGRGEGCVSGRGHG